jgi:hypothetical protein
MDDKGERVSFGFGPGALDMLSQANKNECHKEYSIYLDGDLCQMSAQAKFLKNHGVDVQFNGVYACVRPCDKERTLKLIWEYQHDGWWLYQKEYTELGICDKEEFMKTLNKWCDDKKK